MITIEPFGHVDGRPARAFRVSDGGPVSLRLTNYGARLTELHLPASDGTTADVVLGFDDVAPYLESPAYFGASVGRFGNRITRGQFMLLGTDYQVDVNEKTNHLHGGKHGWDSRLWDVADVDLEGASIKFTTTSADGEMGFPGACDVTSTYTLDGSRLTIEMTAFAHATTVVNMVHHSYFNLAGHASGNVLNQQMRIASDYYIPVDGALMPTGEVLAVAGTPYDFSASHPIGQHLDSLPAVGADVFEGGGGWDHNWCLRLPDARGMIEAADIVDPSSGRRVRLSSTEPGLQMYTGGYLSDAMIGKGGNPYCQYAGFTLETQKFPDSPNIGHFPSTTVLAGETYSHVMEFDFTPV